MHSSGRTWIENEEDSAQNRFRNWSVEGKTRWRVNIGSTLSSTFLLSLFIFRGFVEWAMLAYVGSVGHDRCFPWSSKGWFSTEKASYLLNPQTASRLPLSFPLLTTVTILTVTCQPQSTAASSRQRTRQHTQPTMFFSFPSKDSIRKYVLNATILAGLILVRPVMGQLAGRFLSVEPQLHHINPLPPVFDSHCPNSAEYSHPLGPKPGGRSPSSLFIYAAIFLPYTVLFLDIPFPQDELKLLQAILGILLKGVFYLASEVVRECIGWSFQKAAYPVKTVWIALHQTLRACLEAMPRYLRFPACFGVTTRLLFSIIKELKLVIFCLFFFGLGVVVAMPRYYRQSFPTYAHFASCDLCFVASDLTDRAEAFFAAVAKSTNFLLSSFGLRFSICFLLFSIAFISYHNKKAWKFQPKASRLINDEKEDNVILEDKSLAKSGEDALCDVR
jgi:hypothetical protein